MTADDFFSRSDFDEFRRAIEADEDWYKEKEIRVGGRYYSISLRVRKGSKFNPFGHEMHRFSENGVENIGGGSLSIRTDSYDAFRDGINQRLKRFPDYSQEAQVTWF